MFDEANKLFDIARKAYNLASSKFRIKSLEQDLAQERERVVRLEHEYRVARLEAIADKVCDE